VIAKASGGGIQEAKDGGHGAMDSPWPEKAWIRGGLKTWTEPHAGEKCQGYIKA